ELSLVRMFAPHGGPGAAASTLLALGSLFVVLLAENSRIPVDDPSTHLELTMIHEVMVLDHGGPDFAFIVYGSALKLWVLGALIVGLVLPMSGGWTGVAVGVGGMLVLAVGVGVIESAMARLRLLRVPQLLATAGTLSAIALILGMR
ncbi:MAG: NADH-quinone oxidoreductase subunit H, partial [Lentisphaerae bacterium]|nr:NADH-quinone oxidoreductase subunit H [Lentisphaerota bacterium]